MLFVVEELGFEYPDIVLDHAPAPLLQNINFNLSAGELLHLRGSNGSGKTTLLKLLAGIMSPMTGLIRYDGVNIAHQLVSYQAQLCYVGHKTGMSSALTVIENCQLDLKYNHHDDRDALLDRFSLLDMKDKPYYLLSAGQRRRVGLLRLLLSKTQLWLLDEPLVALDQSMLGVFMDCMQEHRQQGGMVILTSHQRLPLASEDYQEYCL